MSDDENDKSFETDVLIDPASYKTNSKVGEGEIEFETLIYGCLELFNDELNEQYAKVPSIAFETKRHSEKNFAGMAVDVETIASRTAY